MESNNIIEINIDKLKFSFDNYNKYPDKFLKLHRSGDFYKQILKSVKDNGIINPLLVIDLRDRFYKVKVGNNRLIVALELNVKKIKCIIIPNENKETIGVYKDKYVKNIE